MIKIEKEAEILKKIDELTNKLGLISNFPLPVEQIARHLGFRCHLYIPDEDIENITSAVNHVKKKIYVNQNNSLDIQRFSIAKILGNIILHGNNQDYIAQIEPAQTLQEKEAEFFAENLLMPKAEFCAQWQHTQANIHKVANYFGISLFRVTQRAMALGLIPARHCEEVTVSN